MDNKNIEEKLETKNENNEQDIQNNKEKKKGSFVPSYNRKNEDSEKNKKDKKNKGKIKIKSKITIIILVLLLLVIVAISSMLILKNINKNEISNYDELIEKYGISRLYNNGLANSEDNITKSELIKVIIAVTLNTEDITKHMPDNLLYKTTEAEVTESSDRISLDDIFNSKTTIEDIKEEYENEYWVRYAESINFLDKNEITIENYNDKVTFSDVAKYISKAKTVILGKNLDIELTPDFKNYDELDNEMKWILSDLVRNGIIENSKSKIIINETIKKGELNKMIINFVLKYNLITIGDDRININEDKMPSNKEEFAYTLSNIDKKVYEIENYKANENYKNSLEVYSTLKTYYEAINYKVEQYYNTIINIDYEKISLEELYSTIVYNSMHIVTSNELEEYITYVKDNKIKVSGEAKLQNPIIYFDGETYRARTKLTYNIESADTLKNIFFKDIDSTYEIGEKTIYVDVPISTNEEVTSFYIVPETISNMISGKISKIQE